MECRDRAFREDTDIHVWGFTCRAGIRGKYSRCWERKGISVEGKEKQTTGFPHAATCLHDMTIYMEKQPAAHRKNT